MSRRADNIFMSIPLGAFFWLLLPLLSACPFSSWGLSQSPSVVPSTVTPSSPVQSPIHRKNVLPTCALASRLSLTVAPSIRISGIPPPLSEHASSLVVDPGMFPGHSWWSTQSTATTSSPPGVRRAKRQLPLQTTSAFVNWSQGNLMTQLLARMCATSTSNSSTGDKCS